MLSKEEYVKTVKRPYPPLLASLINSGLSEVKNYRPAIQGYYVSTNVIKSDEYWYYPKKDFKKLSEIIFKEWTSAAKIQEVQKIFTAREETLLRTATGTDFTSFYQAYENYIPTLVLVWKPADDLEDIIREKLYSRTSKEEADELMNTLNIPLQDNYYKQEEYDLVICKDLNKHVQKYDFLYSRYGEYHPYTVEDAQRRLENIDKTEFLQKWRVEKERIKQAIVRAQQVLDEKDKYLVDFMQFIVYYRTRRTDIINQATFIFKPQLEKMAAARNLTYQQLLYCLKDEVLGDLPPLTEIKARIKDHAIVMEAGQIRCLSGQESAKIREFLKEDLGDVKELEGTVACAGKVTGIVKIIFGKKDFAKFRKGDILVANMTTPIMTPIMEKAAAFVTEEGGITCHAAIISREMNKPCIIGTEIATQVLQDGDKIEVDAENGTVKIL